MSRTPWVSTTSELLIGLEFDGWPCRSEATSQTQRTDDSSRLPSRYAFDVSRLARVSPLRKGACSRD